MVAVPSCNPDSNGKMEDSGDEKEAPVPPEILTEENFFYLVLGDVLGMNKAEMEKWLERRGSFNGNAEKFVMAILAEIEEPEREEKRQALFEIFAKIEAARPQAAKIEKLEAENERRRAEEAENKRRR
ncbi:MAG: hypothetical protein LBD32_00050, partial [Cytophagales bacterium]|nr:hypothetical protein [Cytophagales bacterium]